MGEPRRLRKTITGVWPLVIIVTIVMAISSGIFVTHQFLAYGALIPSITGGWYGPITFTQTSPNEPTSRYSMYVVFATGKGNDLFATTSSCTMPNSPTPQPPTPSLTYAGFDTGTHFTMTPQGGDVETDLFWDGTYSTDKIHINFYPNGTPTPHSSFADLQRGTYNEFLNTCS